MAASNKISGAPRTALRSIARAVNGHDYTYHTFKGEGLAAVKKITKSITNKKTRNKYMHFMDSKVANKAIAQVKKLAKKGNLVVFDVEPTKGKHDVVGAKILKAYEYIKNQLMRHEFIIKTSGCQFSKESFIYFVFYEKILSKTKKHYGPPVKNKEHFAIFKKKYKKVQTSRGKAVVIIPRAYRKPEELLKKLVKDKEVVTRVKKIQQRM